MPIGWIDFSKSDRDKVSSILDMLGEKATLDELGIAPIRDGFADIFFPGTTTIQTRAKYFLLVPYELRDLELSPENNPYRMMDLLRMSEHDTGKALYEQDQSEHSGVIGRRVLGTAGDNWVKRIPDEIYWAGLRRYAIFRNNLSLTEYLQYMAEQKLSRENVVSMGNRNDNKEERDDADAGDLQHTHFWNLPLYAGKEVWRKTLSMKLTQEEAAFLKRQIHVTCPDSMMDHILQHQLRDELYACDSFRDLEKCKLHFPDTIRQDYEMAVHFSDFVYLLRIQYNRICRQEKYDTAEAEWAKYQPYAKSYSAAVDIDGIFLRLGLVKRARRICSMEFKEVVKNRYSCKKFSGKQVEGEKLTAILEAGRLAPTAKNLQEQHVYVVQSNEALAKVDAITPCRYGAPTVLVVAYDKNNVFTYPGGKRDSGVEDATIVATHMILAAADAGVDSCWVNFLDPEKLAEALGLPENEEVLMVMDLGYAAEGTGPLPNHTNRKRLEQTVSYM